ncbi:O-antigen ligase family protein [Propioniciclava soli]|uniref:O-antigen ligase family protein n=1 Tax=Propioniciclava soli TaxID=2775081 RepID=A0ABZ3CAE3_9ACTN|nr:O-antigen ligase family protein [Propioniciclava soli]
MPSTVFELAVVVVLPIAALVLVSTGLGRPPLVYLAVGGVTIVWTWLSLAWTQNDWQTNYYLMGATESLLVFGLIVVFTRGLTGEQVARVITAWVFLLLLPCVLLQLRVPGFLPPSTLDPASGDYISYFARLSHPFIGRSNNPAALVTPLILPLLAFALHRRDRVAGIGGVVAFGMLVLTMSRGSLVTFGLSIVLYVLLEPSGRMLVRRLWKVAAAVLLVALLFVAVLPTARTFVGSRFGLRNVFARGDLLDEGFALVAVEPWLGTGAGVGVHVHNTFLQQIVWFGIPLGLLLGVLIAWSAVVWLLPRVAPDVRWLAVAIGVSLVGQVASFAIQSSYEGNLLRSIIWLGWGLLFALYQRTRSADEPYRRPRRVQEETR